MKKILAGVCVVLLVMSMLTGCGQNTAGTNGGSENESSGQGGTTSDTLRVALMGEPLGLDSTATNDGYSNVVEENIYDGLFQFDANGQVVPNVASEWTVSEDACSYTFTIKEGVLFHNGAEVTAEDVAYTLELASVSPSTSSLNCIQSVEVVDDHTVVATLNAPNALFLEKLATGDAAGIVCKAAREEMGEEAFSKNPVGCGAYMLKSWEEGTKIELEAFEDYHQGAAQIKNVVCLLYTSKFFHNIRPFL